MAAPAKRLGRKIAEARAAKGWKQKHLAAALEVEPVTISRWETGANTPPVERIFEIAAKLGVKASDLLAEEETSEAVA